MKRAILIITTFAVLLLTIPVFSAAVQTNSVDQRAEAILKQMTLEEKLSYIGGDENNRNCIRAIPRLGIPKITMSDGPMGPKDAGPTCAYPAGIALAATWDTSFAKEMGIAMGDDCRARGFHILLGPGVNIYRTARCGRNFEYLSGEDPFLGASIVVPFLAGIQSRGVLPTVKHYAVNNQEANRCTLSVEIDEQALREIYLPTFKAAVQKGDAQCIMGAYNRVNGVYCSQNSFLQNEILKNEWGFRGILMSDWYAAHDALGCATGGLDLEMATAACMSKDNLLPAIKNGTLSESVIDDKVRRILRTIIAFGFLDRPQKDDSIPLDNPKSDLIALKGARESIVLLKNENNLLPLDKSKVKSILVTGPNADPPVYCGGGCAYVTTFHVVTVADGLTHVGSSGVNILKPIYKPLGFEGPLKMEVFKNKELAGNPAYTTNVSSIDFDWTSYDPAPGIKKDGQYSARWTGIIHPQTAGLYVFSVNVDDDMKIYLDDKLVVSNVTKNRLLTTNDRLFLEPREYKIRVEFDQGGGPAYARMSWWSLAETEKLAKNVDAVVYCGGFGSADDREGNDRQFDMPMYQVQEIQQLAKANPNVIVVLNAGGGLSWNGWLDKVPAVLHAWYTGQEYGRAVADIIFGDVNPSGKLPVTFEKKWEDNPSSKYYDDKSDKIFYKEGIFVGYRGFDKNNIEPQFPFGFGLSYTTFSLNNLKVDNNSNMLQISCDLANTGKREGAEVVQAYIGGPKCGIPVAIKELKGFSRVNLMPGQTTKVTIPVEKKDLSIFDVKSHKWIFVHGKYNIWVGTSERSLPLHTSIQL